MNILLGITGSVAAKLAPKLQTALQKLGDVTCVATQSSLNFLSEEFECLTDADEWGVWKQEESVLHIDLRRKASILVLAPLDANTLAKMANGLCDNLLTSVIRAWDTNRPIVIAPAMNTFMWEHPLTAEHIRRISELPCVHVVQPQTKTLVCGDTGVGAMCDIEQIVSKVEALTKWSFPLLERRGVPKGNHPGAFGYKRKYDRHTGVDLYCDVSKYNAVYAVESGVVVQIEHFTGSKDNSPWWNDTKCVMIEGASGVVNYGEIEPDAIYVGAQVKRGMQVGRVVPVLPVLPEGKERPDLPGHSRSMLHVELYEHGVRRASDKWDHDGPTPPGLKDPTPYLLNCKDGVQEVLECPVG